MFKNRLLKISLVISLFSGIIVFLAFHSPKVQAVIFCNENNVGKECYNGPSNTDSGGCGTACGEKDAWSKYKCQKIGCAPGVPFCLVYLANVCLTGNKCRTDLQETGLRYGTCNCSYGPIYKACCSGSTKVPCNKYSGADDGIYPPEGTCSPNQMSDDTSCLADTGLTCGALCQNNNCDNCAYDNDYKNPSYTWSSLGSSSEGGTCYCGMTKPVATHRECRGASCVTVSGAGTNLCNSNSDCATQTHRECRGASCVTVSGAGTNLCNSNSDCATYLDCAIISAYNGACPRGYVNRGGCCVCP